MIALQRVSGKFGARSPWLRTPRSRPQHSERRTNSTSSKDQINVNTQTRNQVPSHPPNEVSVQATKTEPVDIPLQLWYHRLGPVSDFFNWFHRAQLKRPYTVQVGTTLTTYLCGDLLAQDIGGEPYDPIRTLRMLTIGALASIPGYKWFLFLGRNFNFASKWVSITTKVVINQVVFSPIFNTYFFGMQALLTGEPPSGIIARVQAAVPISVVNSLKLWPPVTAFSFLFIMPQYRFMFSGIFAVAWQAYLSFLNRKEEKIELATDTLSRPVIPEGVEVK